MRKLNKSELKRVYGAGGPHTDHGNNAGDESGLTAATDETLVSGPASTGDPTGD